jgi:uncharacterized protein YciI
MKSAHIILFTLIGLSCLAQNHSTQYDPALADSLGADEYGMKTYFFVLLKTGDTVINNKDSLSTMFQGHFENMSKMADLGNLVVAGPFMKNERDYRGIFIIEAENEEALMEMLHDDPTIKQGVFEAEVTPWYGSAALATYYETHKKIAKLNP